jgi:transposase
MSKHVFRRHNLEFKQQVCSDIRAGSIGRREAQRKYSLSPTLIQAWLERFDKGEGDMTKVDPPAVVEYEAKIAALERKVGQLTMEVDLLKKAKLQLAAIGNEKSSVISGPKAAPSDGGAT